MNTFKGYYNKDVEAVCFFEGDCNIRFIAKFEPDGSYSSPIISVVSPLDTIDITSLLTDVQIDNLYRRALSVRGGM